MTEYDYSPEAYEAYLATQAKISRWVDKTNRLYPYLGNPFTPATPAVHDSDLLPDQERAIYASSSQKTKDRDRYMGGYEKDRRRAIERDGEKEKDLDRDRDRDLVKHRDRDRVQYKDRPDRDSSESHSGSRSRSYSRPPPTRSKSTHMESSRAPHSRRASYDQYAYGRSTENKQSSSKYNLSSSGYSHYASQSKPDVSSSKSRHFHSSSAIHLPKNHLPHSQHPASALVHHFPPPTSAPPLTSNFQYTSNLKPSPTRRQSVRSQTLPPEDRSRGSSGMASQPLPPPVIPQGAYYGSKPQVQGQGQGMQVRGRKVESSKHQQPLLKRLLTNLTRKQAP
ncbi:hypothetical protein L208DRAFT_1397962, partial [Tricholoma matsutake]